jgi:hypothetical protein
VPVLNRLPAALRFGAGLLLVSWATVAAADPWLAPGDAGLRSDVQLLSDQGIVRTPVTSWPLSWADLVRDLDRVRATDLSTPSLQDAYDRVRREARRNTRVGVQETYVEVGGALHPIRTRGFADSPREEGELASGLEWIGDRFAARLEVRGVTSPEDGRSVRFDGSYVGMVAGNVMISAGYMEKWWGPGWAGSLILSNAARPIPSLTIERNYSDPFDAPVLKWLGPWRASFQAGLLEGNRDDYPNAHFMALRIAFRPARGLEIGLSRTAQLCGDGRRCTAGTYWDMIVGDDNDQSIEEQPGNQLAGFDVRYALPKGLPLAVYGQAIGEDEAGFLPSKYLGLAGAETWGRAGRWTWRAYAEYAKTACDFARSPPTYGCAYESSIYTDGYRHRDRPIGHAWDRDARGVTVGAVANRDRWSVDARAYDVDLNLADAGEQHTLAPRRATLRGIEVAGTLNARGSRLRVGLGYDDPSGPRVAVDSGAKVFVEWRARL